MREIYGQMLTNTVTVHEDVGTALRTFEPGVLYYLTKVNAANGPNYSLFLALFSV